MKTNVGKVDKAIRAIIGVVLIALYIAGVTQNALGIVLLILGIILILTSITGFCGIYSLFGWNTCKISEEEENKVS